MIKLSLHLPTQIFLTISVYTTIGVAVERFVSISTHTPQNRVGEEGDLSIFDHSRNVVLLVKKTLCYFTIFCC